MENMKRQIKLVQSERGKEEYGEKAKKSDGKEVLFDPHDGV